MKRFLLILATLILLTATASALNNDVNVLGFDGNVYNPNAASTMNIDFQIVDANTTAADNNVIISYLPVGYGGDGNYAAHEIVDINTNSVCDSPVNPTVQICTYTWTFPAGLDGNYIIDVNLVDITNSEDSNALSSVFTADFNACDMNHNVVSNQVTLDINCTGIGSTATMYYSKSRQGGECAANYSTYSEPFSSVFGEFLICYYSEDSVGNVEATTAFYYTADSDALNVALLTELALAGLLLFVILGAVVLRKEDLDAKLMIALTIAAVLIALGIYIFAVIL